MRDLIERYWTLIDGVLLADLQRVWDEFLAEARSQLWYCAFEALGDRVDESVLSAEARELYHIYLDCQLQLSVDLRFGIAAWHRPMLSSRGAIGVIGKFTDTPSQVFDDCEKRALLWYRDGLLDRESGPASKDRESETWYRKGRRHRVGGPARTEILNGEILQTWYEDGEHHRVGGPAIESRGFRAWAYRGKRHRLDGPAIENDDMNYYAWWVNDVFLGSSSDPLSKTKMPPL